MGYKVLIKASAKKELAKLDRPIQSRIFKFLLELEDTDSPRHSGIALQGDFGLWRYRIGDYRLIAEIEDRVVTITVIKIGHRREVYR